MTGSWISLVWQCLILSPIELSLKAAQKHVQHSNAKQSLFDVKMCMVAGIT